MDPREWQADEWGAFGQVGALVAAVVAGLLVWQQVRHAAQLREDQTRPYVIVDFEFRGWEVVLAIRNIGTSPAMNVRIVFDQPLRAPHLDDAEQLAVFAHGIPMLAPGRVIEIPFGNGPAFFDEAPEKDPLPLRYTAQVEYTGHGGRKRYRDAELVLDLSPYKHTLVERDDLHQIHQNLKDIKNLMKSWTSDRRLRVNTVTQSEEDEKDRLWHQAQVERRAAGRVAKETELPDGPAKDPT